MDAHGTSLSDIRFELDDPVVEVVGHPLAPIITSERRAGERLALYVPVVLQFGVDVLWLETDALLVDLSHSGMQVACDRLPLGEQHVFLALQHGVLGECTALGAPARYTNRGFAVQFQWKNTRMRQLIAALSDPHTESRESLLGGASELLINVKPRPARTD